KMESPQEIISKQVFAKFGLYSLVIRSNSDSMWGEETGRFTGTGNEDEWFWLLFLTINSWSLLVVEGIQQGAGLIAQNKEVHPCQARCYMHAHPSTESWSKNMASLRTAWTSYPRKAGNSGIGGPKPRMV
ncbi:mCG65590, partial [Mus musculus]